MFPMQDHPFSFQMHCIRTQSITGEEAVGNSLRVRFEIQPSKISTLPQFGRRDGDLACWCVRVAYAWIVYVERAARCSKS